MGRTYGKKDGSKRGRKAGGRGRNQTSNCRNPKKKSERVHAYKSYW